MKVSYLLPEELDFLVPYLRAQVKGIDVFTGTSDGTVPVLILAEGYHHEEKEELRKLLPANAVILNCPDIVGTRMTGFVRSLVEAVDSGMYMHFPGNEARRSAIHATDVANAVALIASGGDIEGIKEYTITDGEDPTIDDLAEAFAYRLGNKRISNISTVPQQWFMRKFYGKERYAAYTTSKTIAPDFKFDYPDFSPAPVCEYLRSHNYDENSL